jgi:hypothetical protein
MGRRVGCGETVVADNVMDSSISAGSVYAPDVTGAHPEERLAPLFWAFGCLPSHTRLVASVAGKSATGGETEA